MNRPRLERHYAFIAAGIAVLILYGSLFPFDFHARHAPGGAFGTLLAGGFQHASRDDIAANLLLYLPFGFFAAYALEEWTLAAVASATLAGFAMASFVELMQFYDPGRVQDLTDICSDTLGALLGAAAGLATRRRIANPYLALLLACWLGNRCYPGFPSGQTTIPPVDLLRFFAEWLAVGLILEALWGASRSRIALPVLLAFSLAVRAFMSEIEPAELIGGAAAILLWSGILFRVRARAAIGASLFVVLVALLALAPYHFSATARGFGWLPFRSFLTDGTNHAILVFFDKSFLYGGMLWLLTRAGLSFGAATAFGATLVFCLRIVQVYLPGRSAEITDTILVLMLASILKLVSMATE